MSKQIEIAYQQWLANLPTWGDPYDAREAFSAGFSAGRNAEALKSIKWARETAKNRAKRSAKR